MAVVEEHRQAADGTGATLLQFKGAGQLQRAEFACALRLRAAQRVVQQVVADDGFIAFQRHYRADHAVGRQLQRPGARNGGQQLARDGVEIAEAALVALDEGLQHERRGQCPVHGARDRVRVVAGQVGRAGTLQLQAVVFGFQHQQPGGGAGKQQQQQRNKWGNQQGSKQ
jgi:hypothetical protein